MFISCSRDLSDFNNKKKKLDEVTESQCKGEVGIRFWILRGETFQTSCSSDSAVRLKFTFQQASFCRIVGIPLGICSHLVRPSSDGTDTFMAGHKGLKTHPERGTLRLK